MPRSTPRLATARTKSTPSRAGRPATSARPSPKSILSSGEVVSRDHNGSQSSPRPLAASESLLEAKPAADARTVNGNAALASSPTPSRRTAAPPRIRAPSIISTKSQGLSVASPSIPCVAFGPPARPGANWPTAADSSPGMESPNKALLSHFAARSSGAALCMPSITSRTMKFWLKSRRPSLPPVPSAGAKAWPSLSRMRAASIHWTASCGSSDLSWRSNSVF